MSGCQTEQAMRTSDQHSQVEQAVQRLIWVESANATQDAEASIAKGDTTLLALSSRGTRIPGLSIEDQENAIKLCGVRLLDGTGDAIFSERQLNLLQQVHKYAEAYNRIILKNCN